jgi:biopolymer transport protein ExbD
MLGKRKTKKRYEIKTPITGLIDIVFLLLIYFLLTTNFLVEEGIKIKLPQAKASAPQTEQEITVFVDKQGRAYIGMEEVPQGKLFKRLKTMIGNKKDRLVVIRADRGVMLNKAVRVMDLAKAAGAGKLCLATEKDL